MKSVAAVLKKSPRASFNSLKIDWPLKDQLMGIEIEVDTNNTQSTVFPKSFEYMWDQKRDGSLMNGYEYVLRQPQAGDNLSSAIAMFFASSPVLHKTPTGSTHIHLDMLEENTTTESVKLLVLLFFILEPAIFSMYAPEREWCGYTNKLSSAPEQLLGCILNADPELAGMVEYLHRTGSDRYYGLNVKALYKYGSVELRYFPTATNKDELIDWLTLAQQFKKVALELGTVERLAVVMDDEAAYYRFINDSFTRWSDGILRTVPYHEALRAFNKAQAIASSWQYSQQSSKVNTNHDTLFSGNRYSKLVKKPQPFNAEEAGSNCILFRGSRPAPPAPNENGTVLMYQNRVYVSLAGNGWNTVRHLPIYVRSGEGEAIYRTALRGINGLRAQCNSPVEREAVTIALAELERARLEMRTRAGQDRDVTWQTYAEPHTIEPEDAEDEEYDYSETDDEGEEN